MVKAMRGTHSLVLPLLLLLTLAACQPVRLPEVVGENGAVDAAGSAPAAGDEAAYSLAQYGDNEYARLLALAFTGWDPLQQAATLPKLLLGQVPAHLPFTLEPPAETVLVGSITGQDEVWGSVFFTTTLAPAAALDGFKTDLLAQGLENMDRGLARLDVFLPDHNFPPGFGFCDPAKRFVVWGGTMPLASGVTSVRLSVERSGDNGPCVALDTDFSRGSSWEPLPTLTSPAGVVVQERGGSMGLNHVWLYTDLETNLALAELATIYNQQLLGAGWHLIEQGSHASAAWSLWTLQDAAANAWAGSFYLFADPISSTRYTAILRADRQLD